MLMAVKGYYNGSQIIIDEDVKMSAGQEVIITILDAPKQVNRQIDLKKYMGRGEKMFHSDAQDYIKALRGIQLVTQRAKILLYKIGYLTLAAFAKRFTALSRRKAFLHLAHCSRE